MEINKIQNNIDDEALSYNHKLKELKKKIEELNQDNR